MPVRQVLQIPLAPDQNGNGALHLVCKNGHYEATELLLQSQIGLDQRQVVCVVYFQNVPFFFLRIISLCCSLLSECLCWYLSTTLIL